MISPNTELGRGVYNCLRLHVNPTFMHKLYLDAKLRRDGGGNKSLKEHLSKETQIHTVNGKLMFFPSLLLPSYLVECKIIKNNNIGKKSTYFAHQSVKFFNTLHYLSTEWFSTSGLPICESLLLTTLSSSITDFSSSHKFGLSLRAGGAITDAYGGNASEAVQESDCSWGHQSPCPVPCQAPVPAPLALALLPCRARGLVLKGGEHRFKGNGTSSDLTLRASVPATWTCLCPQ